jgi:hypothetical protein
LIDPPKSLISSLSESFSASVAAIGPAATLVSFPNSTSIIIDRFVRTKKITGRRRNEGIND